MAFNLYKIEDAPEESKPLLEGAHAKFNFIPNLLATMAESPALLKGYMTLSEIYSESSLSATEQQIILLTVSYENECHYCMAAHSIISQISSVPEKIIEAIRLGKTIPDEKLEVLHEFTRAIVNSRGWPSEKEITIFYEAGYSKENLFEVILGVGLKTLSNYTNHIANTPVDDAFLPAIWKKAV